MNIMPKGRDWYRAACVVWLTILLAIPLHFVVERTVFQVVGSSMFPTLHNNEFVITLWGKTAPGRGDIVLIDATNMDPEVSNRSRLWVKRIIGLPGDVVEVPKGRGQVKLNGRVLVEPYLGGVSFWYNGPQTWVLGPTDYFFMGDNRENSFDSRDVGPCSRRRIVRILDIWVGI